MKLMCLFQVKRNRFVLTILMLSLKGNVMKWVSHGGMTWCCDPISSDHRLCRDRLKSLHVKLKGKPELMAEYDAIFREELRAGIIEQVPVSRENEVGVHFMPHHGVVRKDRETSKLRIVFDGSAEQNADEFSLNERLDEGPNYIPSLFDVLVKFRVHPVALTADVETAFLQIQIKPDDRDMLRFLWFDDVNSPDPCIVQFRFCRLPFGLRPSPSILGGTVRKHLENYRESHPDIVEILKELYVDDLSSGADTIEKAPWWGGMWERMIRSVKRCIKKAVGQASLKFDDLHTILVEIEGVINARPITYVYNDCEGISYPLTPSQLIYGRNVSVAPNDKHFEITSTHQSLTRRARHHRKVLNNFTKPWKQEYLLNLREIANQGNNKKPNIEPGDIVLLKNDQTKRCFWKLGKVVELLIGRDGNIRAAKVKVSSTRGTTVLSRPLQLLIPLEIRSQVEIDPPGMPQAVTNQEQADTRTRPRRNAAVIGEILRKDQL